MYFGELSVKTLLLLYERYRKNELKFKTKYLINCKLNYCHEILINILFKSVKSVTEKRSNRIYNGAEHYLKVNFKFEIPFNSTRNLI